MGKWFAALVNAYNRPVLWMATILLAVWGVLLVLTPHQSTLLTSLYPFHESAPAWGLVMLGCAFLAVTALIREPSRGTFWSLIPQQALLMISVGSIIFFSTQGHSARGTVLPGYILFLGQLPLVLVACFHPIGMFAMHKNILPPKKR